MNTVRPLPGFRFVYETDDPNRFVVIVGCNSGATPTKQCRWILDKRDRNSFRTCVAELLLKLPIVDVQNGIAAFVEQEVERLQYPEVFDRGR